MRRSPRCIASFDSHPGRRLRDIGAVVHEHATPSTPGGRLPRKSERVWWKRRAPRELRDKESNRDYRDNFLQYTCARLRRRHIGSIWRQSSK